MVPSDCRTSWRRCRRPSLHVSMHLVHKVWPTHSVLLGVLVSGIRLDSRLDGHMGNGSECEVLPGVYSTIWCLCYKTNELKKRGKRGQQAESNRPSKGVTQEQRR